MPFHVLSNILCSKAQSSESWAFSNKSNQAFMKERSYVYNIFTTNHRWLVVIGLNLNLTLRLFFFVITITTSNNLPLMIYCKNVVKMLWTYHFSLWNANRWKQTTVANEQTSSKYLNELANNSMLLITAWK